MRRENLLPFEHKKCKITIDNDFVLVGTIVQVNDDNLIFSTPQKTSLIIFSRIYGIVLLEREL